MRISFPALICSLLVLGPACQTPSQDAAATAPLTGRDLPLTRFRPDSFPYAQVSGYLTPTQLVIRDQAEWATAWQTLHERLQPVPPLPAIDFDRDIVVLVAIGSRNTGGYSVQVKAATIDDARITLTVSESAPGPTCATPQIVTQPVDVVSLPRRGEAVQFVVHSTRDDCPV